jgi:predicted transcriptional regulator
MDDHELMFELSHPGRLKALLLLREKPHRLTDISKMLDLTSAEISRHLSRLAKAQLIMKDGSGRYSLSPFGHIILGEISNLQFLINHDKYMSTHDFSVIPRELWWLNAISKSKLIEGTLEIMSLVEDLTKKAEKRVYLMSDQMMRAMVDTNLGKAREGVEFRLIYPKNAEVPPEYVSVDGTSLEVRLISEVKVALKLNESIAGIALPDPNHKIDYNFALISSDPVFIRWVMSLFNYYWENAEPAF